MKLKLSRQIFEYIKISNFTKILRVKAELFIADGRTAGQTDMIVLIVAFRSFTYATRQHSGLVKLTRQRWGKHVPPVRRVKVTLIHQPPTLEAETTTFKISNYCVTPGISITIDSALFLAPYISVYLVILSIKPKCIETMASWARAPDIKHPNAGVKDSNSFRDMKLTSPVSCFVVSYIIQNLRISQFTFPTALPNISRLGVS
jgi:hypothetical protein